MPVSDSLTRQRREAKQSEILGKDPGPKEVSLLAKLIERLGLEHIDETAGAFARDPYGIGAEERAGGVRPEMAGPVESPFIPSPQPSAMEIPSPFGAQAGAPAGKMPPSFGNVNSASSGFIPDAPQQMSPEAMAGLQPIPPHDLSKPPQVQNLPHDPSQPPQVQTLEQRGPVPPTGPGTSPEDTQAIKDLGLYQKSPVPEGEYPGALDATDPDNEAAAIAMAQEAGGTFEPHAFVKKVQGQLQDEHRRIGGIAEDARRTQGILSQAHGAGGKVESPFELPGIGMDELGASDQYAEGMDDVAAYTKQGLNQRAALQQFFSPPKPQAPELMASMAAKSPFDDSRSIENYFSQEAADRILGQSRKFRNSDAALAAGAAMLGAEDLQSGLGAAFGAVREPLGAHQKKTEELPLEYAKGRFGVEGERQRRRLLEEEGGRQERATRVGESAEARAERRSGLEEPLLKWQSERVDILDAMDALAVEQASLGNQEKAQSIKEMAQRMRQSDALLPWIIGEKGANIGESAARAKYYSSGAAGGASQGLSTRDIATINNRIFAAINNPLADVSPNHRSGQELLIAAAQVKGMPDSEARKQRYYAPEANAILDHLRRGKTMDQIFSEFPELAKIPELVDMAEAWKELEGSMMTQPGGEEE